jgi:2-methylisocitrate lyase-like PEP mutase family enzyme
VEGVVTQDIDRRAVSGDEFRRLHSSPDLLILTNAWDAISARLLVSLGARAVATSSAAVAWSHGYPDGSALPVPLLIATLRDIARVVSLPITADIEGGYSDDPRVVGETVGTLIDVGVVGINLEDGSGPPDLLRAKIHAAREAADRTGVPIFVNARTDVFLHKITCGADALGEATTRANGYAEAGADGVFVPGVTDVRAIETLAKGIPRPLNVMARPGLPPGRDLQRVGVRRLSAAAWPARVALRAFRESAAAFLATGESDLLAGASGTSVHYNALLSDADGHSASR